MNAHNSLMYIAGLVAAAGDEPPTAEQWAKIRETTEKYLTLVAVEKLSGVREDELFKEQLRDAQRNRAWAEQAYKNFANQFQSPLDGHSVRLSTAAETSVRAAESLKHLGRPLLDEC